MALTPDERRALGLGEPNGPEGSDDDLLDTSGAGLVLNLDTLREFFRGLDELERRWRAVPPTARRNLQRMLWLHPEGHVVPYTTPEQDPGFLEALADRDADPDPFGLADELEPEPPLPFKRD